MATYSDSAANQLIKTDPQIQAILQQARQDPLLRGGASANKTGYQQAMTKYEPQIFARLNQLGLQLPQGYGVNLADGTVGHDNWFERNAPWLMPIALGGVAALSGIGAGAASSAAGGGGGGAAADTTALGPVAEGGGTTAATVPTSLAADAGTTAAADSTAALGPVAASGGTTAATVPTALSSAGVPAGTAAAGTGFGAALKAALPSILPSVIGGGLGLAGAVVGANATTNAAKIAAAEQQKALDQAYAIYQQNVAREKPFVGLGTSSLSALAQGMGLPDPNAAPATPAAPTYPYTKTTPAAPPPPTAGGGVTRTAQPGDTITGQAVPRQSLSDLSTLNTVPTTGGTTRVLNPQNGQVYQIPANQVAAAQQAGGVVV